VPTQYIKERRGFKSDPVSASMAYNSHTVAFLWRATRIASAICVVSWIIASGIVFVINPGLRSSPPADFMQALTAPVILYLIPAAILWMLSSLAKSGQLLAAPLILLVGGLSLFKLVLLATSLKGPYFTPPLASELPARIACALLSVACVYAWEDLADISRNRSRAGPKTIAMSPATKVHPPSRRVARSPGSSPPQLNSPAQKSAPPKAEPQKAPARSAAQRPVVQRPTPPSPSPPPASVKHPRRDEPPPSHTPWS
jgi:hypothetical protein